MPYKAEGPLIQNFVRKSICVIWRSALVIYNSFIKKQLVDLLGLTI